MKALILQLTPIPAPGDSFLREHFEVIAHVTGSAPERAAEIRGIATTAHGKADAALIAQLPALQVISCFSSGTDGIDREAARARGIPVTTTSHLVAAEVADLAMGLAISLLRRIPEATGYIRSGAWESTGPMPLARSLRHSRLGIVGMGNIGRELATRARAFEMDIAYCGPSAKPDLPYRYFADLADLAEHSDILAVCCPATPSTRGLVDEAVLSRLGRSGYLINVARGSIVDEPALIAALRYGRIAGAALDVFANEPHASLELIDDPRVIPLPHVGAATTEVRIAMAREMVRNLREKIR